MLLLLLPLLLVIAFLEKIFDPRGPVFFKQPRLTRFNREFKVYKFRSAKRKYNKLSPEQAFTKMGKPELIKPYRENGDFIPNDPRFTKLGLFLRKTSLDELPQLFNVFKGDISLVGPRALIPQELNAYEKKHAILSVKSGMTGLAQISGRKDIGFDERRKLDIYYVQNWSFWWDIVIMLKTIKAVFSSTGAK
jgi:lipopolysaccharide/colanic/teichoic acid biosynthesis glycosyltransferase